MTEYYADAAHEAYRRLKWQEANRPDPEKVERLAEEERQSARKAKINRLRASVA